MRLRSGVAIKGLKGFSNSCAQSASRVDRGWDVPVLVELVDTPEKIDEFVRDAGELLQDVQVMKFEAAIFQHPRYEE